MIIADKLQNKFYRERDKYLGSLCLKKIMNEELQYGITERSFKGSHSRKEQYIISMASYAGRYHVLPIALKSLLLQTVKPDRIVVWLDEENRENAVTEELQKLCVYGVEYRYTTDGLKPHKKYLYAMQEFPNANIVTVDDDVVYSGDMLESLVKAHALYPQCICARRVHKITFDQTGKIKPYREWKYEYRKAKAPSHMLCATGGGGTLYPANIMPEETFNMNAIRELSLNADDIWLKLMELIGGVKVMWVKNRYVMPLEIDNSQYSSLCRGNVDKGGNDSFLKLLFERYPQAFRVLEESAGL